MAAGYPARRKPKLQEKRAEQMAVAWSARVRFGLNHKEIAAAVTKAGLGPCATHQVPGLLAAVEERTLETLVEYARKDRLVAADRYEMLYLLALDGWERSREDAREIRQRTESVPPPPAAPGARPGPAEVVKKVEDVKVVPQVGDPRFLAIARECVRARAELLGGERPITVLLADATRSPTEARAQIAARVRSLPPEQQRALLALGATLGLNAPPDDDRPEPGQVIDVSGGPRDD